MKVIGIVICIILGIVILIWGIKSLIDIIQMLKYKAMKKRKRKNEKRQHKPVDVSNENKEND